jgi:hypothetical protein
MNQDPQGNYVPRAPGFPVAGSSDTVVTITRGQECDPQSLSAELVDVSQYGVKLLVPVSLRFEEALQLKVEGLGADLEYQGIASVRHIRSATDNKSEDQWIVGCAIAPPLTDEAIAHLATAVGKEQRRFRRLPIAAEASVRRQAQADGAAAMLHNLSSGGISFSSEVQYDIGERVQITIKDTDGELHVVEASICWQVDGPDGSIAGCQFSSSDCYAKICACLIEQPTLVLSNQHEAKPTSKLVLTAAVLTMFVPPMMTLLLQTNKVSAEASVDSLVSKTKVLSEEVVAAEKLASPKPRYEIMEPSEQPQLREWVDNTGKHSTLAELLEATSEYVLLEKSDGRQSKVPWRRLSNADREYAEDWQARQE